MFFPYNERVFLKDYIYEIYSLFGQNAQNTEFIENTCLFCGKSAIPAKINAI